MTRSDPHPPLPDVLLERYALGELDPDEMRAIDERVRTDRDLEARLHAIRRSDREILAEYPVDEFVSGVRNRLDRSPGVPFAPDEKPPAPWKRNWLLATPILAGAAVLAAMIMRPGLAPSPETVLEYEVRSKGLAPHINIYRRIGDDVEQLADGSDASVGDVLQIAYVAGDAPHGVVISVDGRGLVTLHHPPERSGPTVLVPEGEVPIPHAYELDDAPGFERFFLITSDSPLSVELIRDAATRLFDDFDRARVEPLELPGDVRQYSITLEKEPRR